MCSGPRRSFRWTFRPCSRSPRPIATSKALFVGADGATENIGSCSMASSSIKIYDPAQRLRHPRISRAGRRPAATNLAETNWPKKRQQRLDGDEEEAHDNAGAVHSCTSHPDAISDCARDRSTSPLTSPKVVHCATTPRGRRRQPATSRIMTTTYVFYGEDRRHIEKGATAYHGFRLDLTKSVDLGAIKAKATAMAAAPQSDLRIRIVPPALFTYTPAADADVLDALLRTGDSGLDDPAKLAKQAEALWAEAMPIRVWVTGKRDRPARAPRRLRRRPRRRAAQRAHGQRRQGGHRRAAQAAVVHRRVRPRHPRPRAHLRPPEGDARRVPRRQPPREPLPPPADGGGEAREGDAQPRLRRRAAGARGATRRATRRNFPRNSARNSCAAR